MTGTAVFGADAAAAVEPLDGGRGFAGQREPEHVVGHVRRTSRTCSVRTPWAFARRKHRERVADPRGAVGDSLVTARDAETRDLLKRRRARGQVRAPLVAEMRAPHLRGYRGGAAGQERTGDHEHPKQSGPCRGEMRASRRELPPSGARRAARPHRRGA